ncbi:MAG: S8 family peptidase, partial [Lachnospiraceae bacterium]|nr:S8 family peptidase [Lachnospiraceae bacterium]
HVGLEYSEEEINRLLAEYDQTPPSRRRSLPGADNERHGTGVAGIAAGNGRDSEGRFTGVAPESRLIVVKLGLPDPNGFPRTAELMQGLNYVIGKAAADRIPVAINVSVGNTYGAHDGSTLLERYMDQAIGVGRTQIIVGSGNEGDTGGHASGRLENPVRGRDEVIDIELAVGPLQAGLNIQLWKNYADAFEISLVLPSERVIGPFTEQQTVSRYDIDTAFLLVLYGEPSPYRTAQEIYLDFLPTGDYLESGIYRIRLRPVRIVDGVYHLWLPGANARTDTTRFLQPTPEVTLTIPSTSERGITVSAYDSNRETYGTFSGRGFTRVGRIKPDLAAPGVDVVSAAPGGGYGEYTGTSFAAPFVTGSAALLMEWGIVRGNDPFLYGEKIKAYLIRGARELPAIAEYPDPQVGWGTLCLRESIPK